MRKPLIIANWKSNPASLKEAAVLARSAEKSAKRFRGVEAVVAPPFPFIPAVSKILRQAKLGAQDAFWSGGPYTGEVSRQQLKNFGVRYVILGHSSRRILGERDDAINKKVKAVLDGGLKAILCVGERKRSGGKGIPTSAILQFKKAVKGVKKSQLKNLVVAYEPVWAISTMPGARPDTPESAERAVKHLRQLLSHIYGQKSVGKTKMLYGGSVNAQNIKSFLVWPEIEGVLVGGASLNAVEFSKIIKNSL